MIFSRPEAALYVPDGIAPDAALARTTHLGIGAHPDDLEFMAFHGIIACYQSGNEWFGGVTCTDGAGSARTGRYADYTDDEMRAVRKKEQDRAAQIGRYGVMIQLGHPSGTVQDPANSTLRDELAARGFRNLLPWSRGVDSHRFQPGDRAEWPWPRRSGVINR